MNGMYSLTTMSPGALNTIDVTFRGYPYVTEKHTITETSRGGLKNSDPSPVFVVCKGNDTREMLLIIAKDRISWVPSTWLDR